MSSALTFSLIAFAIAVPVVVAIAVWRKNSGGETSSQTAPSSRELESQEPETSEERLSHQFFHLLLKKHQNEQQSSSKLLKAFEAIWQDRLNDPTLFPRQPLVLPRLVQAMKAESSNSQTLVDIVTEDPGLTADVLKLANSPIYRNTNKEIQSIDYALVMLGVDGLHSLVCSSLMRPIFAKRRTDGFSSSLFWDYALASAQAAQSYDRLKQKGDNAQAYMLTLITRLAELVILRICARTGQEDHIANTPAAVLPVIERYRHLVAGKLIDDWGFDASWYEALWKPDSKQDNEILKAQRFAPEFGGAFILLAKNLSESHAHHALESTGIDPMISVEVLKSLQPA